MKIGVRVPVYRPWCDARAVREVGRLAEAAGYDALFVQDHVVAPVDPALDLTVDGVSGWLSGDQPAERVSLMDYYGGGDWWLDPFSVWAYLAAVTERVTLGSDIVVAPYRNPLVQAKMLATIDVLSEGRLLIGTGTGHVEAEFRTLGVDWERRGALHDEYLQVIDAFLSGRELRHDGELVSFGPTRTMIQTVQDPRPPIFVGGNGARSIRRAAQHGDGWLPSDLTPDQLQRGIEALAAASAAAGRDTAPRVALSLPNPIKLDTGDLPSSGRPPTSAAAVVDLCGRYAALGVELVVLVFPMPSLDVYLRQLETAAAQVLSELSGR